MVELKQAAGASTDVVAASDPVELGASSNDASPDIRLNQNSALETDVRRADASLPGPSFVAAVGFGDDDAIEVLQGWDRAKEAEGRRVGRKQQGDGHTLSDADSVPETNRGLTEHIGGDMGIQHPATEAHELTLGLLAQPVKQRPRPGNMLSRAGEEPTQTKDIKLDLAKLSQSKLSRNNSGQLPRVNPVGPQASRKARRNSYSIGYGASPWGTPYAYVPEDRQRSSAHEARHSGPTRTPQRLTPTINLSRAKGVSQPGIPSCPEDKRSSAASHSSTHMAATSAQPGDESGAHTLGSKLRRIIGRQRSRAHLTAKPSSPPPGPGSGSETNNNQPAEPAGVVLQARESSSESDDEGEADGMHWALGPAAADENVQADPIKSQKKEETAANKGFNNFVRPLATLPPFVPRLLNEDIALNEAKYTKFDQVPYRELAAASKTLDPSMIEFCGSVMIADVKGFTQLTEILSKKGTAGVELLTNCMNNYFTKVINMILAFDGDVVKFAGDSMIVLFNPNAEEAQAPDQGLHAATLRCAQCAHVLATRLGHMRMKMNGQVEPINPQANDRALDMDDWGHADSDLLRRNSGQLGAAGSKRRNAAHSQATAQLQASQTPAQPPLPPAATALHGSNTSAAGAPVDSPYSSVVLATMPSGRGSMASNTGGLMPSHLSLDDHMAGADAGGQPRLQPQHSSGNLDSGVAGAVGSTTGGSFSRPKQKGSWIRDVIRRPSQAKFSTGASAGNTGALMSARASVEAPGPSVGSGTAGSSGAGHSPGAATQKRPRARTEVGLLGLGHARDGGRASSTDVAGLWGVEAGGFAKRELSLASKLNIPPPVRMLGVKPGSSTNLVDGPVPPGGAGGLRSFTGYQAESSSGVSASSPSRRGGMGMSGAAAGGASWASKFQNLQSSLMGTGEDMVGIERSRLSMNSRAVMTHWEPLAEEESEDGGEAEADMPMPSSASRSRMSDMRKRIFGRKGSATGPDAAVLAGTAGSRGTSASDAQGLVSAGSGIPANKEPVEEVEQGPAGYVWSDDSYAVSDALAAVPAGVRQRSSTAASTAIIGGYMAPGNEASGPIMEGIEEGLGWNIEGGVSTAGGAWPAAAVRMGPGPVAEGTQEGAGAQSVLATTPDASFVNDGHASRLTGRDKGLLSRLNKMMGRLGAPKASGRSTEDPNASIHHGSGDEGSLEDVSAHSNSFGYPAGLLGRMPAANNYGGKTRDPVMEEVQNSTFSLKIMISAGSVCVFHVGGNVDEVVTDPNVPEVPRWEYFIGDRPLAPLVDAMQRRRCIAQLAAIEKHSEAGEVVGSKEVVDLMQQDWEIEMLPDEVGRLLAPLRPFVTPARGNPPAFRLRKSSMAGSEERSSAIPRPSDLPITSATAQDKMAGAAHGAAAAPNGGPDVVLTSDIVPHHPPPPDAPPVVDDAAARHDFAQLPAYVQRRCAGLLRMHVLGSVRTRIEAGHLDFINEIRPLTCIFLGFPSLLNETDTASDQDQISCVQFAVQQVQEVMRKWDGSFLQFRCDEKGFVGICAFGLPGHTHEDNPSRGILAALELHKRIKDGHHRVCIGVTTGDLLCTCVGARKIRQEYTVFGDAINLSARLMVKCQKGGMGDILTDEPTHAHAKYKANYEELEPIPLKGKAKAVVVYRVTPYDGQGDGISKAKASDATHDPKSAPNMPPERPLIGRDTEMSFILNRAANMIAGMATGGAIVIEGNTGMGKTKLLTEVRKSLERIDTDTSAAGKPAFHLFFGVGDIANKSSKLHPWRRIFHDLFLVDMHRGLRRTGPGTGQLSKAAARKKTSMDGEDPSSSASAGAVTLMGDRLAARIPSFNAEWRKHLSELLGIPMQFIPKGGRQETDEFVAGSSTDGNALGAPASPALSPSGGGMQAGAPGSNSTGQLGGLTRTLTRGSTNEDLGGGTSGPSKVERVFAGAMVALGSRSLRIPTPNHQSTAQVVDLEGVPMERPSSDRIVTGQQSGRQNTNHGPGSGTRLQSIQRSLSNTFGGLGGAKQSSQSNAISPTSGGKAGTVTTSPLKKNSLNFLVHIVREFTSLYGPIILLLENMHEFDMWSWQMLFKLAEVLSPSVLILATTRPNEPPAVSSSHGKAALYQKVAMMYRHLLKLPTTSRVHLTPFTFQQTRALMQVIADINFPDQYVLAVMEKTGGMPLYIEKVTEFLLQKPWLADQGGEFAANVNKMIRNLNFQQVIIERMDRLNPGIHLTLKVSSVMGQWVDLDILHKFYPINKSIEQLRGHLEELERGNFLKPTDTEGVWEFNMVERDIVYEVIPHYQRRKLHAKLAQELEGSLEAHLVATLTTIAYHWNQACMGHEVSEVECSLKAIEFWQRAAEAAYSGSSLMEALRLYQKAADIAEVLGESMGDSFHGAERSEQGSEHGSQDGDQMPGMGSDRPSAPEGADPGNSSFTAVGSAFRGQLNWSLISRITRAQWEKSMASCCLGIVLQHRYEFNNQMEYWDTEDYFTLLTEHAIRGLMLMGAPHPKTVLVSETDKSGVASWLCGCFGGGEDELSGWQVGVVLQDQEVTEIRDILLVLIIAAEHYSLQHDGDEYTRLLTFCKHVCKFFNKCSDTGLDPFQDIRDACAARIKNFKASRGAAANTEFAVTGPVASALQENGLGGGGLRSMGPGGVPGPELSRAVLGMRRYQGQPPQRAQLF